MSQWDEKGWTVALELERTIGFDRHHEWPGIIAAALRAAVEDERAACEQIALAHAIAARKAAP